MESGQGKKLFVFDRVFAEDVNQEGVWDYLKESVNSFVEGYNVSILAYGQSGAGKSYTMGTTGPAEQADQSLMGVVPRAATALFEKLTGQSNRMSTSGLRSPKRYSTLGFQSMTQPEQQPQANRNWQMRATYVEIYQEHLRDLLVAESVPASERPQIAIREDTKGRILLTGLQQITINSVEDLLNALNFGSSIRQTDATAINARSSRSHAVFSLNLIQKRTRVTSLQDKRRSVPLEAMSGESWVTVDSKLHFVDLAGSERLKNTQAHGERAKEGISINAGLASLGKVIAQLSSRNAGSHVSYRDSRLTRLLQDSLGGNAITYMIACINPAEFHLSETLSTVQYAQRARAIQSKPQIQQTSDDSDKQAAIERLRAEVSFLRDQIRLSERTGRKENGAADSGDRHHGRENELQNQLLDIQENYRALSQRHAKLISQITKAGSKDGEEAVDNGEVTGESAVDRLKRSTSFGAAVEEVVLEYEKTIQTLEASLSTTRSNLSNSEASLLEKETKIAYMDTVQQQLQSRIQKAMDREANDENYLRDLEARVVGATSGEEKSNAAIQALRKELARARENESSCEEYICTLEERLAESEQDHEMMQREIQRLEHVVERQRSIGKLDNLLYELDNIRRTDSRAESRPTVNGHAKNDSANTFHSIPEDDGERSPETDGAVKEIAAGEAAATDAPTDAPEGSPEAAEAKAIGATRLQAQRGESPDIAPTSAQSRFVADKLESVTQELFDLKMEHETTVTDFDELQRKYQVALSTLADMQEAVNEARQKGGSSFLAGQEANEQSTEDGQTSSSRTLSSEQSSHGESQATTDTTIDAPSTAAVAASEASEPVEKQVAADIAKAAGSKHEGVDELKKAIDERDATMVELSKRYVALQEEHADNIEYIEELKAEVQKAQLLPRPSSPVAVLRRKSSQMANIDRTNRTITSLRTLVAENFEEDADKSADFETGINTIVQELQSRSDRVATLETELAASKREMDGKMQIISGLTRERSSMKSTTPLDISVVAKLQEQLTHSELQIKSLQDEHATKEQELHQQLEKLKTSISSAVAPSGDGVSSEAAEAGATREIGSAESESKVAELQREVDQWKTKHTESLASMKTSEDQLLNTIHELEASLRKAEQARVDTPTAIDSTDAKAETAHGDVISQLRKKVEDYKSSATENANRVTELDQSYQTILAQVEENTRQRELTEKELETHKNLVSNLEDQLVQHQSAMADYKKGLQSIQDGHSKELDEATTKAQTEANERLAKQMEEHQKALAGVQTELTSSKEQHEQSTAALREELRKAQEKMGHLVDSVAVALNQESDATKLESHVRQMANDRKTLVSQHENVTAELASVRKDFESSQKNVDILETKISELKTLNEEVLSNLQKVSEKEQKSSKLVEELEDQLNANFDAHQTATKRLSVLQTQRDSSLDEVLRSKGDIEKQLEDSKARITLLEVRVLPNLTTFLTH